MEELRQLNDLVFNTDKKIIELRNKITQLISELPDNPKIKRLSKNCFVMNFKDLSTKNWTPTYYDFKRQYAAIVEIIETEKPENIDKMLTEIIIKGKIRYLKSKSLEDAYNRPQYSFLWGTHNTFYFHPEVIKYLKSIY